MSMQDSYGRKITYLRLSVTDRCDFRCGYCMAEKMTFMPRKEVLTLEECVQLASVFVEQGVEKLRITGGEPLVRKDMPWLVERLRVLPGLRELVMTTNASQLAHQAQALADAGLDRINISLDSLDAQTFTQITRTGDLHQVLEGIETAIRVWGPRRIKLNVVLLRDLNVHELPALVEFARRRELDISFIEQMPLGEVATSRAEVYVGNEEVLARLQLHYTLQPSYETSGGPARYWRIDSEATRIGLISPHSDNFCADCNRVRITARGELYTCLGDEGRVELMPALRMGDMQQVRDLITSAIANKPRAHTFNQDVSRPVVVRFMSHTGG